jgi:hypothetical protein
VGLGVGAGVAFGPAVGLGVGRRVAVGVGRGFGTTALDVAVGMRPGLPVDASVDGEEKIDGENETFERAGCPVAPWTSPCEPRVARTTASATAPTTRIAAIAASRRCFAIDSAGTACRRRVVEPATRVTPDRRFVEPDDLARPAGRTPSASSLAADATNRDRPIGPGPTTPESPRGRRVRRRSVHIPSESSTIRGSRTRCASSRGTNRTAIAAKPRTTSAPTIHSTGVDYPQRPVSPSRPVAILASDRDRAHPSDCVRTPPLRAGSTRWSSPGATCDASAQRVPAGAAS